MTTPPRPGFFSDSWPWGVGVDHYNGLFREFLAKGVPLASLNLTLTLSLKQSLSVIKLCGVIPPTPSVGFVICRAAKDFQWHHINDENQFCVWKQRVKTVSFFLRQAVRLKEKGIASEIVAVSCGPAKSEVLKKI